MKCVNSIEFVMEDKKFDSEDCWEVFNFLDTLQKFGEASFREGQYVLEERTVVFEDPNTYQNEVKTIFRVKGDDVLVYFMIESGYDPNYGRNAQRPVKVAKVASVKWVKKEKVKVV